MNFILPIKLFGDYILVSKALRPTPEIGAEYYNDIALFLISAYVFYLIVA